MKKNMLCATVAIVDTFDRITVKAQFPSGGSLRFTAGRSRDTLSVGASNDPAKAKVQIAVIDKWCRLLPTETHGQRAKRIADLAKTALSVGDLVTKIGEISPVAA